MKFTDKISRKKLDLLVSGYASSKRTLEVGAWGNPSYGRFFDNKIGIDIRTGHGVDMIANVYELPFPNEEFENVLCLSVLEHLEDPRAAIKEMHRVIKRGGRIIVSVPFMFPIHDAPGDYWRFTKFGLRQLFQDGWEIEKLCAETSIGETIGVIFQRIGYQTKLKFNKLSKFALFSLAKLISRWPSMVWGIFGDIHKKVIEPEAFASAFFMVAKKV